MEGSPHLFDFEGEMAHYAALEEEIQELPEVRQVGAILLSIGRCEGFSTSGTHQERRDSGGLHA